MHLQKVGYIRTTNHHTNKCRRRSLPKATPTSHQSNKCNRRSPRSLSKGTRSLPLNLSSNKQESLSKVCSRIDSYSAKLGGRIDSIGTKVGAYDEELCRASLNRNINYLIGPQKELEMFSEESARVSRTFGTVGEICDHLQLREKEIAKAKSCLLQHLDRYLADELMKSFIEMLVKKVEQQYSRKKKHLAYMLSCHLHMFIWILLIV